VAGSEQLRSRVQAFARGFGFLRTSQTPCGRPLPLSQAHALMFLRRRGATQTLQRDLGVALGIDKSNVTRLCRKMESAGHVRQVPARDDARARVVTLTVKGARLAREVESASRAKFERLYRALPAGERAPVIAALDLLVAAAGAS
jgi:DNA-binding MarR family transcriptional regulator